MIKKKNHMWTKEEIKRLIKIWDSKTKSEIAKEMNLTEAQISAMVANIRKAGYPLPKKTVKGYLQGLVKEAVSELKKDKTR